MILYQPFKFQNHLWNYLYHSVKWDRWFFGSFKHDAKKKKINHEFPCVPTTKNVPVKQEKRTSSIRKEEPLPPSLDKTSLVLGTEPRVRNLKKPTNNSLRKYREFSMRQNVSTYVLIVHFVALITHRCYFIWESYDWSKWIQLNQTCTITPYAHKIPGKKNNCSFGRLIKHQVSYLQRECLHFSIQ